ncbi:MAG TPA: beta-propeller fold lactonase family protein, partial [Longimicrobiales bacterium]|nr:beta-propeller fold lactonase family protein [Longimicrobiales bacterium]
ETNVRHIPTVGGVHNVFVTPDGRHVVAGHIGDRTLTVIETATDRPVWSIEFEEGGVRPMEFDLHPDGSTKYIYVEISGWHGFYVVDFGTREVVKKVKNPDLPLSRVDNDALQGSPSHGLARTPDGRTLWVASKPHNSVYAYSLPDHELLGRVAVGHHPDWLVPTPDSRYLYAANAGSGDVSVVERETLEEVARIPVGHTPKRAHTMVLEGEVPWEEATTADTEDGGSGSGWTHPRSEGASGRPDGRVAARGGRPAPSPIEGELDFTVYRERVEPILLEDRGGHGPGASACVTCHVTSGTPMKLEPLHEDGDGGVYWTEEQSRRNFVVVSALVEPGNPGASRLLREPLAEEAGGSRFHIGGKFWESREDPEWRALAAWVRAADAGAPSAAPDAALVPSFEFFRSCVQRIFLDREEEGDRMECAACHGTGPRNFARALPEGRDFWNEAESRANFGVVMRYVEPGYPLRSRFLTHPLDPHAGGDHYHSGGRRWRSPDDPEWRMLAAWVNGKTPACVAEDR